MVFSSLSQVMAIVDWTVTISYGLDLATFAIAAWLIRGGVFSPDEADRDTLEVSIPPTPTAPRARRFREVTFEVPKKPCFKERFGILKRKAEVAPAEVAPALPKPQKRVTFAEGGPKVREVERWFDPAIHLHLPRFQSLRFGGCVERVVERYIVPDSAPKLNFPRTKWMDPLPEVEDQDGDIDMSG